MNKVCGLIIAITFVFLVLASGCIEKPEEVGETGLEEAGEVQTKEEPTTKSTCDDLDPCTKDVYNKLTNECEFTVMESCCGNGICESGERCNENTHLTNCIEDCTRTCPAFLIVHKTKSGKEPDVFAMSCGEDNCEQTDVNKFRISSDSSVKTVITNIGEKSSSIVSSSFMCWSGEKDALSDGDHIYMVFFEDYFNDNQDNMKYINPIQSGDNSATYYLSFDTSKIEKPFLANCKVFIRSTDFENKQEFILSFS